jgi:hypothetical protein
VSAKQLLRLVILFGVVLVLWGAAALVRRREVAPAAGDAFRLPPITRSQVDTVVLSDSAGTVVLAKKDTSAWTANGHRADMQAVADLLTALTDSAPGGELVAERKASHAALGVDSAGGTRVRVAAGGRTLAELVVGHRAPELSGGYVRRAGEEPTWLVRGGLVNALSRRGDEWRDHRIAAVPPDSIAAIELSRGARRYTVRRAGSGWTLAPGGTADSAQAEQLVAAFRTVDATGFAPEAQADSARFERPDRRTRLLRKDGTPLLTLLFDSTAAGFRVRADTGKTVYTMDGYSVDRLVPADSTLAVSRVRGKTR